MENAKINSTNPQNSSVVPLGKNTLIINYQVPVSLSTRNITIYQIVAGDNPEDYVVRIRQITSGLLSEFCSIDPDSQNQLVTVKVLPSTFSIPNSEYHIYIGPNFVKYNETDEPINKLPHSNWILHTGIY